MRKKLQLNSKKGHNLNRRFNHPDINDYEIPKQKVVFSTKEIKTFWNRMKETPIIFGETCPTECITYLDFCS